MANTAHSQDTGALPTKDLKSIEDLNPECTEAIMSRALELKIKSSNGIRREPLLDGRVIALVFEKPSLRTKVAFEVACAYFGATPVFLSSSQIFASGNNQRGRESIPDIGRNLERFCDAIVARVYSHRTIIELAQCVSLPVINALCDEHHPTQALADLMNIRLHIDKTPKETTVAFVGDGNNVATSLMQVAALMGYNFRIASPKGFEIPKPHRQLALTWAKKNETELSFHNNPNDAVNGVDIVYTDTFISMGQENEAPARLEPFRDFQVNSALMKHASTNAIFMHCLPAHRGEEVTDEVMDSHQSVVFDQAECRLHIAKALLSMMIR